jgi:O-antigen/teichoic acid export membrane protein
MPANARPESVDLRLAWMHAVLCVLSVALLVALQLFLRGSDWLDRLAMSCTLAYAALIHARLVLAFRRGEAWAREGSIHVALLMMAAPFGTVIGALMLWSVWGRDRPLPRRKPQVPLIDAWPEADRLRARVAEGRGAPGTDA